MNFKDKDIVDLVYERHMLFTYAATKRAISDVRDGLKPVSRKSIFATIKISRDIFIKAARITGDTIGKYHPHSAESVYMNMIVLSQPFNNNLPLFDAQGNIGTPYGDKPAAMRYVEKRISEFTSYATQNININSLWENNFDETLLQPKSLSFPFPVCLINGSKGIGIGIESSILPHNINEIIDALIFLLKNYDNTNNIEQLLNIVKGPDFPSGGTISSQSFYELYTTGKGSVTSRGIIKIKENILSIVSLPYGVQRNIFLRELAEVRKNNIIPEIEEIMDLSKMDLLHITIKCKVKKIELMQEIIYKLFTHTSLQKKIRSNMILCNDNHVRIYSLEQLLKDFIIERKATLQRELNHYLHTSHNERNKLLLEKWCVQNSKKIISLIRSVKDIEELKPSFIELKIPDINKINEVLSIPIGKLSKLEEEKINHNIIKNQNKIDYYYSILNDENNFNQYMIEDWLYYKKKFGKERITQVVPNEDNTTLSYDVVICIFNNFIFKIHSNSILSQKLSNSTKAIFNNKLGMPNTIVHGNNQNKIFITTSLGRGLVLNISDIPHLDDNVKNIKFTYNLQQSLQIDKNEILQNGCILNQGNKLLVITSMGKLVSFIIPDINRFRISKVINLNSQDKIIKIINLSNNNLLNHTVNDSLCLLIVTKAGKCNGIILDNDVIKSSKKGAKGYKIIQLKQNDHVIDACTFINNNNNNIILFNILGKGKAINVNNLSISKSRVKIGIQISKSLIAGVISLNVSSHLYDFLILTNKGRIFKSQVENINKLSRYAQGHKILSLKENEEIYRIVFSIRHENNLDDNNDDI